MENQYTILQLHICINCDLLNLNIYVLTYVVSDNLFANCLFPYFLLRSLLPFLIQIF